MEAEQLKSSSQRWMNAALAAFAEGTESYDFAVHHAGVAAEHLLKAYLAQLHPALIVDGRHFDSLLHATGLASHAAPLTKVKTIGLGEAHERAHRLLRGKITIDKKALEPLADARNGVAHSAIHDSTQAEAVFTICLRLIDPVLEELKVEPAAYWGPYLVLHDKLIDEQVKAERVLIESKLVRARAVFQQRFGHLSSKEQEIVLAAITSQSPRVTMEQEFEKPCPACGSQGWVVGDTSWGEVDEHPVWVVTPHIFTCNACDLEVVGEQLSHLGDLAEEFELDPADYWEPDEDLLRGR
jgi:hypothetical protein